MGDLERALLHNGCNAEIESVVRPFGKLRAGFAQHRWKSYCTALRKEAFGLPQVLLCWHQMMGRLFLIFLTSISASTDASRVSTLSANMRILHRAVKQFKATYGRLPTQKPGLRVLVEKPKDWPGDVERQSFLNCTDLPVDPWRNEFRYFAHPDLYDGFVVYSIGPKGIRHSQELGCSTSELVKLLPSADRELIEHYAIRARRKRVVMYSLVAFGAIAAFSGILFLHKIANKKSAFVLLH